jgi:hypothetical protein
VSCCAAAPLKNNVELVRIAHQQRAILDLIAVEREKLNALANAAAAAKQ